MDPGDELSEEPRISAELHERCFELQNLTHFEILVLKTTRKSSVQFDLCIVTNSGCFNFIEIIDWFDFIARYVESWKGNFVHIQHWVEGEMNELYKYYSGDAKELKITHSWCNIVTS